MKTFIYAFLLFVLITCDNTDTVERVKNVFITDTLIIHDSINHIDTVIVFDTIISPPDTIITIDTTIVIDTLILPDTVILRDTVFLPADSNNLVSDAMKQVNPAKLLSYLENLAEFDRLAINNGTSAARAYIKETLESFGYSVEIQAFPFSSGGSHVGHNIIVEKTGTTSNAPIVFGAHYDSRSAPITNLVAPGADDNASGVATLMHLAELLATRSVETSVRIVFFDAEEQGLHGSDYYADSLAAASQELEFMFNLDMIAGFSSMAHTTIVCEEDRNNINADDNLSKALNNELVAVMQNYTTLSTIKGPAFDTDYEPFEENGNLIIGLYESYSGSGVGLESNPNYHQTSDTYANINQNYFTEAAKGAIAFVLLKAKLVE